MSSFATTRLTDISATLDPADRALLNLWVNRGLDDHALSGLTRLNPDTIAARRRTIVERLSAQLGLPPEQVDGALEDLAASSRQSIVQETNGHGAKADRAGHSNGSVGAPDLTTAKASPGPVPTSVQADPTPVPGPAPPSVMFAGQAAPSATGRRRPLIGVGLLLIALLAGIVVALASGGSRNAHAASASTPTPSPAPFSPTFSSAAPSTAAAPRAAAEPARRRVRARRRLTPLPRGRFRARGSVGLVGSGSTLRLDLNLRSVPGARHGHYEMWLYDSALDSRPLARLRPGRDRLELRLPADFRHFRSVDVSFQPRGLRSHSGQSLLRAANPTTGLAIASPSARRSKIRRGARRHPQHSHAGRTRTGRHRKSHRRG
jgi:hypothetical protein